MNAFKQALQQLGEAHFDDLHKKIYSVDASIYEVEPIGIFLPKTEEQLIEAVKLAYGAGIPVIARGAATGITGGCLGKGLIIDTSKYLTAILEVNYEEGYAICQPGVVQDRLNEALSAKGYRLGPDTSTGNRATLGGMLANNAAGARSLRFGTMADHIESVDLILANGETITLTTLTIQEWEKKLNLPTHEGNLYRSLYRIREIYSEEIGNHFPKLPRRVSGYNLDCLINPQKVNFGRLIAGSEGSLGIAAKIKLKIVKKPVHLGLTALFLSDMYQGMDAIPDLLNFHPLAIELIDSHIIESSKKSPSMRRKLDWLQGNPNAIFVIEFDGSTPEELKQKLADFEQKMALYNWVKGSFSTQDSEKMAQIWEMRKSGLGLLLSKRSYSRAIAFIEDISIPPEKLGKFMRLFHSYLNKIHKSAGIYGHIGSGCMHIRPYIDLRNRSEMKLMETIMIDVADMLLEHGGAMSGEHGDGRVRSWLNKKMFGEKLYEAFLQLKRAFDPANRMNPGKVVNGTPFLDELRLDSETPQVNFETFLDFSEQGGFDLAVDMCNGNGQCRKSEKVMCPSFQATQDEFDTTRARAQTLRELIHGKMDPQSLDHPDLIKVLDLCLECKGCKTECPSEVDMAKMKAEVLYQYQKKHPISLRNRLFGKIGPLSRLAAPFYPLANWLNQRQFLKRWLGIAIQRNLPKISKSRFSTWYLENMKESRKPPVVLFNDSYTEFYQPEIGQAAFKVLQALGYKVIVPSWTCCGRPAFSKGLLPEAREQANQVIKLLLPYAQDNIPIIGLEPSCILTVKDDYSSLVSGRKQEIDMINSCCLTFDQFVAQHIKEGKLSLNFRKQDKHILMHGHCHQKALLGTVETIKVLRTVPGCKIEEIASGCCGMAGSFGYEQEHYEISMRIGELKLFPKIREVPDAEIVADGFSCRCQVEHGTQRKAMHLAEFLANALSN